MTRCWRITFIGRQHNVIGYISTIIYILIRAENTLYPFFIKIIRTEENKILTQLNKM